MKKQAAPHKSGATCFLYRDKSRVVNEPHRLSQNLLHHKRTEKRWLVKIGGGGTNRVPHRIMCCC